MPGTSKEPIYIKLRENTLKSCPRFRYLSYHSPVLKPSIKGPPIMVNCQTWSIDQETYRALIHLRCQFTPLLLWVTSGCVYQYDADGIIQQYRLVSRTVRRATETLLRLGASLPWAQILVNAHDTEVTSPYVVRKREKLGSAARDLMNLEVFRWIGTCQEIAFAHKLTIQVGRSASA